VRTAVVLFTRDLRVHDQPALAAAAREAEHVVPLFVLDDGILGTPFARPNRVAFLREALADLDGSLAARGARLVLRRGDVVTETIGLAAETGADAVFLSEDASDYARRRRRRLERACAEARLELRELPGVTVAALGDVTTAAGTHFGVFTPYYRAWLRAPRRPVERPPARLSLPAGVRRGRLPGLERLVRGAPSPELPPGGEGAGRRRLSGWIRSGLVRYGERHDDLAGDATSRLSPYLHFGCLSPLEVAERARDRVEGESFVRQLAWRDFHHQLLAARPEAAWEDLRSRGDRWSDDEAGFAAWTEGRTGYPIVDAGMRQLRREGFMHNRARLVAASFLTKDLYVDWRRGARHFFDWLVDGDVANNVGNWQWVAGTGADTRPNRVFNPVRQARRFDPDGAYVRRNVPELAGIAGAAVHEPWTLGSRRPAGYPEPIVDHAEAAARFATARRRSNGQRRAS
jgi:deoxyribodipyrimidine photo-lyase